MGASDWAGRMARRLNEEFGTSHDRNLRITALIRWFASNPEYQEFDHMERPDEWEMLTNDLPSELRKQPGTTLEQRWNFLMADLGYQELVAGGVYLQPWDEFDADTYDPQVTHDWSTPPENS